MYCKNCGKLLAGDEKFCSNCGSKVEVEAETVDTQDEQKVVVESFPTSNMVWDLNDFEEHSPNLDSNFNWDSRNDFCGENARKEDREQDAADYKGPLMFRKEEKAPSKEEIEKKEKEEESTKKSTLYADDGKKGEGNRWDITNVEIPDTSVETTGDEQVENSQIEEEPMMETPQDDIEAVDDTESKFVGFVRSDIEDDEIDAQEESKNEFQGFKTTEEPEDERLAESKEELQAALDQAIDQAIEQDFPSKREQKEVVFDWNQEVNLPSFRKPMEEVKNQVAEESEEEQPAPLETKPEEPVVVEQPQQPSEQPKEMLDDLDEPKATGYNAIEPNDEVDNVIDNNMTLTLEELAAGVKTKSESVPSSNYDEEKKTIRNVFSKDALKQTINFSMDENEPQAEIEIEEKVEPSTRVQNEPVVHEKKSSRVVDIEQPKKSNISLEIKEDDVTGDKIEKVIEDEPKVPEESLKLNISLDEDNGLNTDNEDESKKISESLGFTHKEIDDNIKVGQVQDDQDSIDHILSPSQRELTAEDDGRMKFYTFNKNKEEFQKLLDQEYRRIESNDKDTLGFEEDIAGFMDIQRGKNVEATSQIEEMNKARNIFLNRPSYSDVSVYDDEELKKSWTYINADEAVDEKKDADKIATTDGEPIVGENDNKDEQVDDVVESGETAEVSENENAAMEDIAKESLENDDTQVTTEETEEPVAEKARVVFEPQNDESLAETLIEKEQAQQQGIDTEEKPIPSTEVPLVNDEETEENKETSGDVSNENVGKIMIDPNEITETERLANEFFDDEDNGCKRSKGKNFLLGVLVVIIVIVIALLGIKIIIPESPISKVLDDIGNKVVQTVTNVIGGDDNSEADRKPIRETVIEDKAELIGENLEKNYNNNIETFAVDDELVYNSETEYGLTDLVDAKDIQTVLWYEDDKGNPHYYDEEIVGTVIEFISMKSAWQNEGDKAVFGVLYAGTEEYEKVASLERNSSEQLVNTLAFGDIKVAGNAYYVWTTEVVGDETVKRIYEIKEQDQKLYVNDDCEI